MSFCTECSPSPPHTAAGRGRLLPPPAELNGPSVLPQSSAKLPPGNKADGTSVCGVPASTACDVLNAFVATSTNQGATWTAKKVSSAGHQPECESLPSRANVRIG